MTTTQRLLKSHPWKIIAGLIAVILVYVAFFQFFYVWMRYGVINAYGSFKVLWSTYLMNLVPLSILWIVVSAIVFLPDYKCKMALRIGIILVLSIVGVVLINLTFITVTNQYVDWSGTFFNCFMIDLICCVVYYETIRRQAEEERRNALHKLMEYKNMMIRSQFKPHFLFNSLNILYSMAGTADIEDVRRYILSLSQLYRYILDNQESTLVNLENEMSFLEHYLHILSLRYDEKLQVHYIGCPPAGKMIVPFSLQLLVENVVKHNRFTSQHPISVSIRFFEDRIEVENPIVPPLTPVPKHSGIHSLDALKGTYENYQKNLEVKSDGQTFKVIIPLIDSRTVGRTV